MRHVLLSNPGDFPTIDSIDRFLGFLEETEFGIRSFKELVEKVSYGLQHEPNVVVNKELMRLLVSTLEVTWPCISDDSGREKVGKVLDACYNSLNCAPEEIEGYMQAVTAIFEG